MNTGKFFFSRFFATHAAPVSQEELISYIQRRDDGRYASTGSSAARILDSHVSDGYLVVDDAGNFSPGVLTKTDAVAFVLLDKPEGMSWKEIRSEIDRLSLSPSLAKGGADTAISLSPYIHLYGQGVFRHNKYLRVDNELIKKEAARLVAWLHADCLAGVGSLRQYWAQYDHAMNYYEFRYFVRQGGLDVYFNGRAGSDTVSLKKSPKTVSNKDIVIEALQKHPDGLTKSELEHLVPGNKQNLLSLLGRMVIAGEIGIGDDDKYSLFSATAGDERIESLLRDVVLGGGVWTIQRLMEEVEVKGVGFKRFKLMTLRLAKKEGWYTRYMLISMNPLPYRSIYALISSAGFDVNSSVKDIQSYLLENIHMTEGEGKTYSSQWRAKARSQAGVSKSPRKSSEVDASILSYKDQQPDQTDQPAPERGSQTEEESAKEEVSQSVTDEVFVASSVSAATKDTQNEGDRVEDGEGDSLSAPDPLAGPVPDEVVGHDDVMPNALKPEDQAIDDEFSGGGIVIPENGFQL